MHNYSSCGVPLPLKKYFNPKMAKIDIFQNWVNLNSSETPVYANVDNFQNIILLNMKTNVVLTFVPLTYKFEVVLTRQK